MFLFWFSGGKNRSGGMNSYAATILSSASLLMIIGLSLALYLQFGNVHSYVVRAAYYYYVIVSSVAVLAQVLLTMASVFLGPRERDHLGISMYVLLPVALVHLGILFWFNSTGVL